MSRDLKRIKEVVNSINEVASGIKALHPIKIEPSDVREIISTSSLSLIISQIRGTSAPGSEEAKGYYLKHSKLRIDKLIKGDIRIKGIYEASELLFNRAKAWVKKQSSKATKEMQGNAERITNSLITKDEELTYFQKVGLYRRGNIFDSILRQYEVGPEAVEKRESAVMDIFVFLRKLYDDVNTDPSRKEIREFKELVFTETLNAVRKVMLEETEDVTGRRGSGLPYPEYIKTLTRKKVDEFFVVDKCRIGNYVPFTKDWVNHIIHYVKNDIGRKSFLGIEAEKDFLFDEINQVLKKLSSLGVEDLSEYEKNFKLLIDVENKGDHKLLNIGRGKLPFDPFKLDINNNVRRLLEKVIEKSLLYVLLAKKMQASFDYKEFLSRVLTAVSVVYSLCRGGYTYEKSNTRTRIFALKKTSINAVADIKGDIRGDEVISHVYEDSFVILRKFFNEVNRQIERVLEKESTEEFKPNEAVKLIPKEFLLTEDYPYIAFTKEEYFNNRVECFGIKANDILKELQECFNEIKTFVDSAKILEDEYEWLKVYTLVRTRRRTSLTKEEVINVIRKFIDKYEKDIVYVALVKALSRWGIYFLLTQALIDTNTPTSQMQVREMVSLTSPHSIKTLYKTVKAEPEIVSPVIDRHIYESKFTENLKAKVFGKEVSIPVNPSFSYIMTMMYFVMKGMYVDGSYAPSEVFREGYGAVEGMEGNKHYVLIGDYYSKKYSHIPIWIGYQSFMAIAGKVADMLVKGGIVKKADTYHFLNGAAKKAIIECEKFGYRFLKEKKPVVGVRNKVSVVIGDKIEHPFVSPKEVVVEERGEAGLTDFDFFVNDIFQSALAFSFAMKFPRMKADSEKFYNLAIDRLFKLIDERAEGKGESVLKESAEFLEKMIIQSSFVVPKNSIKDKSIKQLIKDIEIKTGSIEDRVISAVTKPVEWAIADTLLYILTVRKPTQFKAVDPDFERIIKISNLLYYLMRFWVFLIAGELVNSLKKKGQYNVDEFSPLILIANNPIIRSYLKNILGINIHTTEYQKGKYCVVNISQNTNSVYYKFQKLKELIWRAISRGEEASIKGEIDRILKEIRDMASFISKEKHISDIIGEVIAVKTVGAYIANNYGLFNDPELGDDSASELLLKHFSPNKMTETNITEAILSVESTISALYSTFISGLWQIGTPAFVLFRNVENAFDVVKVKKSIESLNDAYNRFVKRKILNRDAESNDQKYPEVFDDIKAISFLFGRTPLFGRKKQFHIFSVESLAIFREILVHDIKVKIEEWKTGLFGKQFIKVGPTFVKEITHIVEKSIVDANKKMGRKSVLVSLFASLYRRRLIEDIAISLSSVLPVDETVSVQELFNKIDRVVVDSIVSDIYEYFNDYRMIFAEFIAEVLSVVSITMYPEYEGFYEHIRALFLYAIHQRAFIKAYIKPLFYSTETERRIRGVTREDVENILKESGLPHDRDNMRAYGLIKLIINLLPDELRKKKNLFRMFLSVLTISVMKDKQMATEVDKKAFLSLVSPQEVVFATILLHMIYPPVVKDVISRGVVESIESISEDKESQEEINVVVEEMTPIEDYTEGMSEEQKSMIEFLHSKEQEFMLKPFSFFTEAGFTIKPYL